jgi:hypothetical protein
MCDRQMTYHVKIHFQRHGQFRPPTALTGMSRGGALVEALRNKLEGSRVRFPMSRTLALASTHLLREMSIRVFSWGWQGVKVTGA